MNLWYKLEGYNYKQWNYWRREFPKKHIEDLVNDTEGAKWTPVSNFFLSEGGMSSVSAKGTKGSFPYYIKLVDADGTCWYYFYTGITKTNNTDKNGKLIYEASYQIDDYQTAWCKKLNKLRNTDLKVFAKNAFASRKKTDDEGYDYIDIIKDQKYLSYLPQLADIKKYRKEASTLTEETLFNIQRFADSTVPGVMTLTYDSIPTYNTRLHFAGGYYCENYWNTIIKGSTSNKAGKYTYIVAKPSSIHNADIDSDSIILIPILSNGSNPYLFSSSETGISNSTAPTGLETSRLVNYDAINKLNDINIEGQSSTYTWINPAGDNCIGFWTCDIPFCVMCYDKNNSTTYQTGIAINKQTTGNVYEGLLYIVVPIKNTNKLNLFPDYLDGTLTEEELNNVYKGIQTRISYLYQNQDKLLPETEPLMFHPDLYNESFNNGISGMNIDLSLIKPTFYTNLDKRLVAKLYTYITPIENMKLAYSFEDINISNDGYDNTNTLISDIANTEMYFGSAASNYFTNNITTLNTAQANIQDQQRLRALEASASEAKEFLGVGTTYNPLSFVKGLFNLSTNMQQTQERIDTQNAIEWRNYNSQIKNIQGAPAQTLSTKAEKASVPAYNQDRPLFNWYEHIAHDSYIRMYFSWYLHNGYLYNDFIEFNKIDNRKYMNIYSISGEQSGEVILDALGTDNEDLFNSDIFNKAFLLWLEDVNKIYETDTYVNVYNWEASDYVHNIEKE